MSDELISKDKILKTIREWTNEYIPQTKKEAEAALREMEENQQ